MEKLLLVRYGELGLKGKNKNKFIDRLVDNIRKALADLPPRRVYSTWGRIWVQIHDDLPAVNARLQKVFGIYSLSPVRESTRDIQDIKEAALSVLLAALPNGGSFKVETKRADKSFPLESLAVSQEVASYLFDNIDERYRADMHHPERTVNIEIRLEGVFVYGEVIAGAGGLPVGCSGKGLLLLSGGIDSPVAGWMAMKRGVTIEAIHFYSFPFTGEKSKEKVLDLCQLLAFWNRGSVRLHVVHFTDIQKELRQKCREEYGITLMRRMMFRLAQEIASRQRALVLYTGESVGQVASQTLESMAVINKVVDIPVLRPLVGMDKEDIVHYAKRIDSFDISIRPYEDCCTLFLPEYPKTRPILSEVEEMEKELDIPKLMEEALQKTQVITINHRQ